MKTKNLKIAAIFIGCLVGLSAILSANMVVSADTELPEAVELEVDGAATSFTFANDSMVVEFTLTLEAGQGVNITLRNNNGTELSWSVAVEQEVTWNGEAIQVKKCIKSGAAGNVAKNAPKYDSLTYLAIDEVTLQICVMVEDHWDDTLPVPADDGKLQLAGGSIQAVKLVDITEDANKLTAASFAYNLSASYLTGMGIIARTFEVDEDGWYLFAMNASNGNAPGEGVSTIYASVIQTDDADAATMVGAITYAYGEIKAVGTIMRQSNAAEKYLTYLPIYLKEGETYVLYVSSTTGLGNIGSLTWSALKAAEGTMEAAGVAVNFASADLTVAREANDAWSAWVAYDSFEEDVLYDLSLSAIAPSGNDWWSCEVQFLSGPQLNDMDVALGQVGQVLFIEDDCSEEIEVDGNEMDDSPQYMFMETQIGSGVLGGQNGTVESWSTGTIGSNAWDHQLAKVTIMNGSGWAIGALPSTTLITTENEDGVPDFPESETTLTLNNVGGNDDQGIYLLEDKDGMELQFTFTGLSTLIQQTASMTFLTEKDSTANPGTGAINLFGVAANSWGSRQFTNIKNDTVTWGGANPTWDSVKVWELAVFVDKVYVLIRAPSVTFPNLVNTSSITINYEEEKFLANKKEFTASRDNRIQGYKVNVGPCSEFALEPLYGGCCSLSASVRAWGECNLLAEAAQDVSAISISYPSKMRWPHCISVKGYLLLTATSLQPGTVVKLVVTTPSVAIPGYPLFFTVLASLGVVAALIWKRRR